MNIYFIFLIVAAVAVYLYIKLVSPHVQGITIAKTSSAREELEEESIDTDVLPKDYEKTISIKTKNESLADHTGKLIFDGKYKGLTIKEVNLGKFSHDEYLRGTMTLILSPSIYQEDVSWRELAIIERKENTLLDIKVDLNFDTPKRESRKMFVD